MPYQSHSQTKHENNSATRSEISKWFSHTTRPLLSYLFLIYIAPLSLSVATVTRHGVGSVTCREAGRRQRSVYLKELEPQLTCRKKKMSIIEEYCDGNSESNDQCNVMSNALTASQHCKVTLRISKTTSSVTAKLSMSYSEGQRTTSKLPATRQETLKFKSSTFIKGSACWKPCEDSKFFFFIYLCA